MATICLLNLSQNQPNKTINSPSEIVLVAPSLKAFNLFTSEFKWLQSTFVYDIPFTDYLIFSTRFTTNINIMGTKEG